MFDESEDVKSGGLGINFFLVYFEPCTEDFYIQQFSDGGNPFQETKYYSWPSGFILVTYILSIA